MNVYTLSYLFDEFDVDNCKIELRKHCPVKTKKNSEGHNSICIKHYHCVHTMVSGRTRTERYKDNKGK